VQGTGEWRGGCRTGEGTGEWRGGCRTHAQVRGGVGAGHVRGEVSGVEGWVQDR
jgi:hypothetical protein